MHAYSRARGRARSRNHKLRMLAACIKVIKGLHALLDVVVARLSRAARPAGQQTAGPDATSPLPPPPLVPGRLDDGWACMRGEKTPVAFWYWCREQVAAGFRRLSFRRCVTKISSSAAAAHIMSCRLGRLLSLHVSALRALFSRLTRDV